MTQAPSTVLQVALLIMFLLPGAVYQLLRERWRGPVPGERVTADRVLRAVTASIALDSVYAMIAGPHLVKLVWERHGWADLAGRSRLVGFLGLLLFVVVPAVAAGAVSWWQKRRLRSRYRDTPTAWDHMFRSGGSRFVRARLKDGTWAGGWFGEESYATSYPQPNELFLQRAWRMNRDGTFGQRLPNSAGLFLRIDDIDILEFLSVPESVPAASSHDSTLEVP